MPRWFCARACGTSSSSASIFASSQCEASSFSVSAGPSTHRLSLLTARNGSAVDQRLGLDQPAAGLEQQVALVGDADLQPMRAAAEMRLERVGEIVDVDDHLLHARRAQPVEHMVEQRLAGDLDQRLGPGRGQRPHALAEPGGHDHRGLGHLRRHFGAEAAARAWSASRRLLPWLARDAAARCSRRTSRGPASSRGCARSRSSRPHMRGWNRR